MPSLKLEHRRRRTLQQRSLNQLDRFHGRFAVDWPTFSSHARVSIGRLVGRVCPKLAGTIWPGLVVPQSILRSGWTNIQSRPTPSMKPAAKSSAATQPNRAAR